MESWQSKADYRKEMGIEREQQYHIECTPEDIAPIVLVPGDQGRVKTIVEYFDNPKKVADNRGLITYTGTYNNTPVTVTSTGMGGPSAAIVYEELINIGANFLVRIGSVAGLQEHIKRGDIVLPHASIRDDGASQYYVPDKYPAAADPILYNHLFTKAEKKDVDCWSGINWTHSAFYSRSKEYFQQWARKRVISMEMEASCLFTISQLRGVKSAFIGTVYENRYSQSKNEKMDLSVGDIEKKRIQKGVKTSIEIALEGVTETFRQQ